MSHLFGPVPSRRLGRSLGVDLVPRKTCPFDCIYCEVGPTTNQTETRLEYQADSILAELAAYLRQGPPELDYITLAGSGEPTLNLGLGRIIRRIKALTGVPVAVLTNGALLYLPEVRRELAAADLVLPSLDAAREETFRAINRPLPGYPLSRLIDGLEACRREYTGRIWLEILLLKGLNDSPEDLEALRRTLTHLAPDKVQLNTAVRPGVEDYARPLNLAEMGAISGYLADGLEVEVIAAGNGAAKPAVACDDAVLVEMLARRPMTAADLARVLGLPLPLVRQRLLHLCETGQVAGQPYCDQEFYRQVSEA
ncbi:MAG: radical SAM protein [Deltaproteobacteria bacterium]|nr:radical SAM protein [Deltaproteobacteria bacterium]